MGETAQPATPPGHDEDHEPSFGDYLISLRTMEPRLRALTAVVVAQIVVSSLMLALRDRPSDALQIVDPGFVISLPPLNCAVAILSLTAALAFAIAGLASAKGGGRWAFLLVLGCLYFVVTFVGFPNDGGDRLGILVTLLSLPAWWQLALSTPGIYRRSHTPEQRNPFVYWSVLGAMVVSAAVPTLFFAVSWFKPNLLVEVLVLIGIPLPYLFLLAGTDWAEITDSALRSALKRLPLSNRRSTFLAVNALVALVLMAGSAWAAGWGVWLRLGPAALGAALLFIVLRLARYRSRWPMRFPWAALAIVVTVSGVVMNYADRVTSQGWALDVAGVAVAAIALVVCRRRGLAPWLAPALLYVVALGFTWLIMLAPVGDVRDRPAALIFCVAAGSLCATTWIGLRRTASADGPLRLILLLNGALVALYVLADVVYAFARSAGDEAVLVFALVMFAALIWDIVVSGHSITNLDDGVFPRGSRVFLFFAYVTLVVATVEFFGSLTIQAATPGSLTSLKLLADPEFFVQRGIAIYGPAMLLTLFLLRLARGLAGASKDEAEAGLEAGGGG